MLAKTVRVESVLRALRRESKNLDMAYETAVDMGYRSILAGQHRGIGCAMTIVKQVAARPRKPRAK